MFLWNRKIYLLRIRKGTRAVGGGKKGERKLVECFRWSVLDESSHEVARCPVIGYPTRSECVSAVNAFKRGKWIWL